jgi:predicted AlkP superfamily phosphohydrolase/phosphomutase
VTRDAVLMFGLDAFDPQLAVELAGKGQLPTLARLFAEGARCTIRNPYGLFVGALWVSFATALKPARHRFHCWEEIDVASYQARPRVPPGDAFPCFWDPIEQAGFRVATFDVPHSRAKGGGNGIHVAEWGAHDRHFGLHSDPPDKAAQIVERFGLHPVLGMTPYEEREFCPDDAFARKGLLRTAKEEQLFLKALREGVAMRGRLLAALLQEEPWDLFVAVFEESHSIGHQQWHLHDRAHPRFDAEVRDALGGDPIAQIYRDIDVEVGRLIAQAPTGATILVHLSHGMGPHHDGVHLLEEVLTRLDASYENGQPDRTLLLSRLTSSAKPALRKAAEAIRVPPRIRAAAGRRLRGDLPHLRAGRRFFLEPNNSVYGGVRLNVKGREPQGLVHPEAMDALCDRIAEDLLQIVNLDTGRPAIRAVERCDRHHLRDPADRMPDLFVDWDHGAPIEALYSPKIGTVKDRYMGWRTGDHKPDGLLLAYGPGIPGALELPPMNVEDLGPSIAGRMGVPLDGVDGIPAAWLAAQT